MTTPFTIEEIIPRLQLLRLNVMPPYVNDNDEGQQSDDEYISFYQANLDKAVAAIVRYIKHLEVLLENPSSGEALNCYLTARKAFVESFPFTEDEFPAASTPEHQPACAFLKSAFARRSANTFSNPDLENLREYRSLLAALQRVLPRPSLSQNRKN